MTRKYLLQYEHGYVGSVALDSHKAAADLARRTDAFRPAPEVVEYMPVSEHLAALDNAQAMIGAAELAAMEARAEARVLRETLDKVSARVDAIVDGLEANKGIYIATLS
jgi:hypothetical protein